MTATPTKIVVQPKKVEITWDDGTTQYWSSIDELKSMFAELVSAEQVKMFLLAWWLRRSPTGSNTSLVLNKTLTFDLEAASVWKIQ